MCRQPPAAQTIRSVRKTDPLCGGQGHGTWTWSRAALKHQTRSWDSTGRAGLDLAWSSRHRGAMAQRDTAGICSTGSLWQGSPRGVGEAAVLLGVLQGGRWAAGSADSATGWAQHPTRTAINQWTHSTEKLTPARTHPSCAEGRGLPRWEVPLRPGLRAQPLAGLTREGIVGIEEVDLLVAVPVNVTGCHTNGIALPVPQCIVRGARFILCHVHQPPTCLVVLEHQVGAIVPASASRGNGSLRLGNRDKNPHPICWGTPGVTPDFPHDRRSRDLYGPRRPGTLGCPQHLNVGLAQPGSLPACVGHPVSTWLKYLRSMPGQGPGSQWGRMGCRSLLGALLQGRETGTQGKSSPHAAPHRLPARSCPRHQ